ncbi:HalOD1 output domain-containing protein [Halegenticoccus soli]|uniref:HalOD1 output domain-containing protein n=1 Tax=Halegenticoccus soli TaxID=1985678 RepID=UPI0018EC07A5|nr:HalOD1 output domain-containing protein [Halegenticoccus soli]
MAEELESTETVGSAPPFGGKEGTAGCGRVLHETWYHPAEDFDLSSAVVFAVAAARGVDPVESGFSALYDRVDADALEVALFGPSSDGPGSVRGEIAFEYGGATVAVRSDGRIRIYDRF